MGTNYFLVVKHPVFGMVELFHFGKRSAMKDGQKFTFRVVRVKEENLELDTPSEWMEFLKFLKGFKDVYIKNEYNEIIKVKDFLKERKNDTVQKIMCVYYERWKSIWP